ncbi:MAG: diaminopimelate epimerase [Candidatus Theseobacter exili]|nr:diaminopimelate epimerase [Candidatus Theseobacter exili]
MINQEIEFEKMTGAGNDFIIIDNRKGQFPDNPVLVESLCRRKVSVGADGVILLEKSEEADFAMRIFNADGSEAEMCGNGARCIARFAFNRKIAGASMRFMTGAGIVSAQVSAGEVVLDMGFSGLPELDVQIDVNGTSLQVYYLVMGVPHTILFVDNIETIDVEKYGQAIRNHDRFHPAGTNVDFVKIEGENRISVRTYERGVEAETLACGTGVSASAILASMVGNVKKPVKAVTKSGDILVVDFKSGDAGEAENVVLTGPAVSVYEGKIEI